MPDLAQLLKYVAQGSSKFIGSPFTTRIGVVDWTIATDQKMLVAFLGKGSYPDLKAIKKLAAHNDHGLIDSLQKALTQLLRGGSGPTVEVKSLQQWAGQPRFGDIEPGKLLGRYWDLRRIANLLEVATEPTLQLWDSSKATDYDSITFIGKTWRASLAVLSKEGGFENAPEYQLELPVEPKSTESVLDLMDLVDP